MNLMLPTCGPYLSCYVVPGGFYVISTIISIFANIYKKTSA